MNRTLILIITLLSLSHLKVAYASEFEYSAWEVLISVDEITGKKSVSLASYSWYSTSHDIFLFKSNGEWVFSAGFKELPDRGNCGLFIRIDKNKSHNLCSTGYSLNLTQDIINEMKLGKILYFRTYYGGTGKVSLDGFTKTYNEYLRLSRNPELITNPKPELKKGFYIAPKLFKNRQTKIRIN